MSATNSTANYGLPVFVSSDVPSWLTDWNGAMGDIDTAIAAAKATADSALLASGNNTTDITTIQGQITVLQTTVGTHTTQIGTISGNINTINSLIGNGTPTTTDQTIIGAINELHADQGDLDDLTTTDKSSLVAAINEAAQGGGGSPAASAVSYDNTGSGLAATDVQDAIDEVAGIAIFDYNTETSKYNHTGTTTDTYTITEDGCYYIAVSIGTVSAGKGVGLKVNDVRIGNVRADIQDNDVSKILYLKAGAVITTDNTNSVNATLRVTKYSKV